MPVGSLRAQRRVLELRAADLALTRKEAEALCLMRASAWEAMASTR